MNAPQRILFLHANLSFSSVTERLVREAEHLVARGADVTIVSGSGARTDEVRATGAELVAGEPIAGGWRRLFTAGRTRRLIAQLVPDVVHVVGQELAPLAARLGHPYVLELYRPAKRRIPFADDALRAVILPCRTLDESIVNRGGLPRDRIVHLPHCVGPIDLRASSILDRDEPARIGCAGHLAPDFGAEVFLDAAQLLLARGRKLSFFVFGEGPLEDALRRRVRDLAIADSVTITAPAAPSTLEILAELDIFVSPRLDAAPGWFAHEALALGLPCVLSAVQGAFELVEDGIDGMLVERGDAEKLADAIQALLDDPSSARALGATARRKRRAGGPSLGTQLDELYKTLLEAATTG